MEQEIKTGNCCDCHGKNMKWKYMHKNKGSNAVYGFGFVGAAIYYIQHSPTFWVGVIGLLKAVVWPAFLVYHALVYFGI